MFIVNTFFLPFLYSLYLSLHQKHQKKLNVDVKTYLAIKAIPILILIQCMKYMKYLLQYLMLKYDHIFVNRFRLQQSDDNAVHFSVLYYHPGLGFPLPLLLLPHRTSMGKLQQHLEHRYTK